MKIAIATLPVLLLLFYSCTKGTQQNTSPPPPDNTSTATNGTDSATLHFNSLVNVADSFEVKFDSKWNLVINPENVSWLHVSAASGTGKTKIYIHATQLNTTATKREATIVVTPEDSALQAVTLSVSQDVYSFTLWNKLFGGTQDERFRSSVKTRDGNFLLLGTTASADGNVVIQNGQSDIWLVKVDPAGNKLWEKTYGTSIYEEGISLIPVTTGGYLIAGGQTNGMGSKPILIKIDEEGAVDWQKVLDVPSYELLDFKAISTGGYIACGYGDHNDAFILKVDESGSLMWFKSYGGVYFDRLASIVETFDGGFVATGNTDNFVQGEPVDSSAVNIWVIKINADGNLVWNKQYGGSKLDFSGVVISTHDGGFLVSGTTKSSDGDLSVFRGEWDAWIFKIDAVGTLQWQRSLGGQAGETINAMLEKPDGSYLLAGWTTSHDGDVTVLHGTQDAWFITLDFRGEILHQKTVGGNGWNTANSIQKIEDNKYLVTGSTESNAGNFVSQHGLTDAWVFMYQD